MGEILTRKDAATSGAFRGTSAYVRRITLPAYRITCREAPRKFGDTREENAEIKAGTSFFGLSFAGIAKTLDGFFRPGRSVGIRPARTK
ncbi:MAG: hypothetical protein LBT05_08085 [Planctomycetaceae bacterium]|nr:hypothetical protein [Planctomycetaceae bacterium]